jgi:hypothetical protein
MRPGVTTSANAAVLDQLPALRTQQALFADMSRQLGQLSGIILLLLADRSYRRVSLHLPVIAYRHNELAARIATIGSRDGVAVLRDTLCRLDAILNWLRRAPAVESLSALETSRLLGELHQVRTTLLVAGRQNCGFTMVHYAAACCCGQHHTTNQVMAISA